jgi:hypothetical protein
LSWEKIKRKIDFDVEVTPEKKSEAAEDQCGVY